MVNECEKPRQGQCNKPAKIGRFTIGFTPIWDDALVSQNLQDRTVYLWRVNIDWMIYQVRWCKPKGTDPGFNQNVLKSLLKEGYINAR